MSATDFNPTIPQLTEERDQALAEVARLVARLEQKERFAGKGEAKFELLKDAALCALEYITAPNPYEDPGKQRAKAIAHLEDALHVNGSRVLEFEIKSDQN